MLAATDLGGHPCRRRRERHPALLIVDSVQTLTDGWPGGTGRLRGPGARGGCPAGAWSHEHGTPVLLVGHVTKDGSLAGPRTLEHLVDVGADAGGRSIRLAAPAARAKNRFGSTEEVGVLEMTGAGLARGAPTRPARSWATGDARRPGVAVAAVLEGSRPLLVEVQALVAPAAASACPAGRVAGIDGNRLALLVAVLARRCGLDVAASDLYASLAGGASVDEPALDLPLALALASSQRDVPRAARHSSRAARSRCWASCGPCRGLERRLREAARLGFRRGSCRPAMGSERLGRPSQAPGRPCASSRWHSSREALARSSRSVRYLWGRA